MSQQRPFTLTVPVGPIDHIHGSVHAPVIVVEYGDFECPNCRQAAPVVNLLLERFAGRASAVFRHFPLEESHPHALLAAQAAECAAAQGKFWEMHDLLFANQSHLKPQNLRSYAERLQLDLIRFDAELGDEIYLQRVRENIADGVRSGVRNTPTFYINGIITDVSFNFHALLDGVQAILDRENN